MPETRPNQGTRTWVQEVSWNITNRCNLKCQHCYANSGPDDSGGPLPSDEDLTRAFEHIGSVRPVRLTLSGGEPLLHPMIHSYISHACQAADETWICTNATEVDDAFLRAAKSEGVSGFSVSLQHTEAESEDDFRGKKGTFDSIMEALPRIKSAGFKLTIEKTILTCDLGQIDQMIELAAGSGADVIYFKRLRPAGRAMDSWLPELRPDDNRRVLEHLFDRALRESRLAIKVDDPLYSLVVKERSSSGASADDPRMQSLKATLERKPRYWGCKAAFGWVGIDPDGTVMPCPLLTDHIFQIGNVFRQPLSGMIRRSSVLRDLRGKDTECHACADFRICGGCRVCATKPVALKWKTDPMCVVGPRVEIGERLGRGDLISTAQLKMLERSLLPRSEIWLVLRDLDDFSDDSVFFHFNRSLISHGCRFTVFVPDENKNRDYKEAFLESVGGGLPDGTKWDGRTHKVGDGSVEVVFYDFDLARLLPPIVALQPSDPDRRVVFVDLPWKTPDFHIRMEPGRTHQACATLSAIRSRARQTTEPPHPGTGEGHFPHFQP